MLGKEIQQQDYRSLYDGFRENPDKVIADAKEAGSTLTHYLDRVAPPGFSSQPEGQDGKRTDIDAALEKAPVFQRILHDEGLAVNSDPLAGHYAVQANEFFASPFRRALFAELCYQRARAIWYGGTSDERSEGKRAVLFNSDVVPGEILNAWFDRPGALLDAPFESPIPLSEIVAFTSFIPGQDYRALYFQRDREEHRMVRVPEGTPVPSGVLRHREHTISLPKRGRAIEFTYEVLRNPTSTIDRMLFQIQMIALESELDLLEDAIRVLQNGDGNIKGSTSTIPTYYHGDSTAPTAHPASLTYGTSGVTYDIDHVYPEDGSRHGEEIGKEERWLAFEMRFQPPFMLNRILTRTAEALELKRLTLFPMSNNSQQELQVDLGNRSPFFPTIRPINPNAGEVRMGYIEPMGEVDDTNAKNKTLNRGDVIGFDYRLALERLVEVGSEIQEVENFVRSQSTVLVITENSNFAIFQPGAVKLLKWN